MNETTKIPPNNKVFIVEDDKFIRDLLVKRLEGAGAIVGTDEMGSRAAADIKKTTPNIILLDILLPGADGFQVLQQLKADPETRNIPVIMLSNLAEKVYFEKAEKYGAVSYLVKATLSVDEIVGEVAKQLKIAVATRG